MPRSGQHFPHPVAVGTGADRLAVHQDGDRAGALQVDVHPGRYGLSQVGSHAVGLIEGQADFLQGLPHGGRGGGEGEGPPVFVEGDRHRAGDPHKVAGAGQDLSDRLAGRRGDPVGGVEGDAALGQNPVRRRGVGPDRPGSPVGLNGHRAGPGDFHRHPWLERRLRGGLQNVLGAESQANVQQERADGLLMGADRTRLPVHHQGDGDGVRLIGGGEPAHQQQNSQGNRALKNPVWGHPAVYGLSSVVCRPWSVIRRPIKNGNYLPKNRFIKTTKDTKAAQRAQRTIFYPFVSFVSTLCPLW
jgi:hypothetical protein